MPRINNIAQSETDKATLRGSDWRSHPATFAQKSLIRRLGLVPSDEIADLKKGYASDLIKSRLEDPSQTRLTTTDATEPQKKLVRSLCESLGDDVEETLARLNRSSASSIIEQLRARHKELIEIAEGFYYFEGHIYKVRRSEKGWLYALLLAKSEREEFVSNGVRTYAWVKAPGLIHQIKREHALTKETAKEFGLEHSVCIRCGAALDPTIKTADGELRWIGPECEKKMGWN